MRKVLEPCSSLVPRVATCEAAAAEDVIKMQDRLYSNKSTRSILFKTAMAKWPRVALRVKALF